MKRILFIAFAIITGFTQAQVKKNQTKPKPRVEKKWVNPVKLTKEERSRPYMDEVLKTKDSLTPEEAERRRKNIAIGNPFAKYGVYPKIATLSKGKYLEFHDTDSIVVIGSIRYNTKKGNIIEVREIDLSDPDAQPIGDTHGRWMSPDPLSEEFSSWSPYHYAYNNPINAIDPDGRESKWIPTIEFDKNKSGELTGGHLALQMEKGDTAETLAKTLNIDQKQADKLFAGMQKSGETSIDVPESIAGSINDAITDAIVNSGDYSGKENYNCFACAFKTARGESLKEDYFNYTLSGDEFQTFLKAGFEKAGANEKVFGKTILAWKGDVESKYFGMTIDKTKGFTHAATYLGTSRNGTEYTFSKNGQGINPKIETTNQLRKIYGNQVGYWNKSK
ncbi:RHS repeat domain-containing protein [Chryseobacterium culicis]|uniref:RHS repeat-associated core domain-containing protein n=1 Tax=Chryseobacterium culicis TaxID=680127 RepID=A0A1H6GVK3_CHRCI|nr:RHS repeat-associated core domain-containing protein [Chryseobacterium culicis]SEH27489.1 RHS repeat-associated core domain-containing protein [Chryseobacterium culicis]